MKKFIEKLKLKLIKLVEYIHLKFFGHEMSDTMREFLGNLSWSFFGGVISAGILFIVQVIAARWLGPEEFGKFSLIFSMAGIIALFINFGIDTASVHSIAKESDEALKRKYMFATLIWNILAIIIVTAVLLMSIGVIVEFFGVSRKYLVGTSLLAIILATRNVMDVIFRGFGLFTRQASYKMLEAIGVLWMLFVCYYFIFHRQYTAYVYALVGGFVMVFIFKGVKLLRNSIMVTKKEDTIKNISRLMIYGKYAFTGGAAAAIIFQADKIIIGKYFGEYSLGLYNAYYTSSVMIATQLAMMVANVFFAIASSEKNKKNILRKINKIFIRIFPIGIGVFAGITFFVFKIYGSEYTFSFLITIIFSIVATLIFYFTNIWWLIASDDVRGIRFTSLNGIIMGGVFIGGVYFFQGYFNSFMVVLVALGSAIVYGSVIGNVYFLVYDKNKIDIYK